MKGMYSATTACSSAVRMATSPAVAAMNRHVSPAPNTETPSRLRLFSHQWWVAGISGRKAMHPSTAMKGRMPMPQRWGSSWCPASCAGSWWPVSEW
jgi:hypothetical protein